MFQIHGALEAMALVTAVSIDVFAACFGYGVNGIAIPFRSAQLITMICTGATTLSVFLGSSLRSVISREASAAICFAVLFVFGVVKLFDGMIKRRIRRRGVDKDVRFKLLKLNFVLHIYADPEEADADASRVLSMREALFLALALSLDGLTAGFGAGLNEISPVLVAAISLIVTYAAVMIGCALGRRVSQKLPFDLSWMSGAMLIGLAVAGLF